MLFMDSEVAKPLLQLYEPQQHFDCVNHDISVVKLRHYGVNSIDKRRIKIIFLIETPSELE